MPEGALLTTTVESALVDLAASRATGCLVVRDQEGDEAEVYLRDGEVYSVMVPGRRVMLGVRLMSSGALTPEALAEALEIQRTELQGWRLGELLVHLGYVEQTVVEEFVVEHLKDALADLFGWPVSAWKFRKNKKTRQDVAPPTSVAALLDDLRDRATTWEQILASIGGPHGIPVLDSGTPSDDVPLGPNEWALLCKIDNERTVAELAVECGFTLFEAGQVVSRLTGAGLVAVPVPQDPGRAGLIDEPDVEEVSEPEPPDEAGSELVLPMVDAEEADAREAAERELARVERAEAARLATEQAAADHAENEQLAGQRAEADRLAAERAEAERAAAERAEAEHEATVRAGSENKRLREAEILHKELEALAAREAAARQERADARRKAREEQAERARAAEGEAGRAAVEEQAWADHAAWTAEERLRAEAARAAAEAEHAARLAAERAEAEESAWADHADWLEQQRRSVEEQAWAEHADWTTTRAAEAAEAARVAAEAEAARAAAEAEAEAARLAAQAEADRQAAARDQAERELAAEAERRAQEQAERAAAAEAEEIARADAERRERSEADRLAAEAAEAIAAEEAAKVAAEHEAEVRRQAALELARFTAQEQERQAAEAQAQVAAEQEQAARAEAQRAADQAATAPDGRTDGHRSDADVAAGAARAAQAASMLTELNRDMPTHRALPVEQPPVEQPAAAAAEPAPVGDAPAPMVDRDQADTAMLLRELSSLGFGGDDDRPTNSPPPTQVHRQAQSAQDKKKRKGLFGRG